MFKKIMVTKKRKKLIETKKNNVTYSIELSSIAIILIVIGIIGILSTFIFFPQNNTAQCSTGPVLSPNYIEFLIFGFGMISLMLGIAMLYAGRKIK